VDKDNYVQYESHFTASGYRRIDELGDFTKDDLMKLCTPYMTQGAATRLMKYVKEDIKNIEKHC
jgi:hypothetical protein